MNESSERESSGTVDPGADARATDRLTDGKKAAKPVGSMEKRRHPNASVHVSAVDWWIAILLMAGPLICAGLTVVLLRDGRSQEAAYCLLTAAGILVVIGLFTVPCRYTILDDSLTIRCGVLFYRIELDKIQSIEPSRSWLSGPALSLRRVKVSTASRFYLISPQNRDDFIEELRSAVKKSAG